jgi:hypothetical protein
MPSQFNCLELHPRALVDRNGILSTKKIKKSSDLPTKKAFLSSYWFIDL